MGPLSLRQRNRLEAMRLVQATALDLFDRAAYGEVTVEAVSAASGVSASTIYRHFGTKENLVLWDERDDVIESELTRRLADQAPVVAFRQAAIVAYAERADIDLFLRRLRLVYAEPVIWGAAAQQDRLHRAELAAGLAQVAGRRQANLADELIAASCLAALDVALERWQAARGDRELADLIDEAFELAARLESG